MKKNIIIGLVISGVCIYFAARGINFAEVARSLQEANYIYLIPTLLIVLLTHYLRCYRWGKIMESLVRYDQKTLFALGSIGFMAVLVLPARLGEFARPYLAKQKSGIKMSATMATIIVERVFDLLALMIVLFLVVLKIPLPPDIFKAGMAMLTISFSLFLFLIFVAIKKDFSLKWIDKVLGLFPERLRKPLYHLSHSFIEGLQILPDVKKTLYVGFLSFVIWLASGFSNYILFYAFDFHLHAVNAFAILVIVALGVMLPAAPGFLGTYHLACRTALTAFGISQARALSYAVVIHIMQLLPIIVLGLIFLPLQKLSLGSFIKKEEEELQQEEIEE